MEFDLLSATTGDQDSGDAAIVTDALDLGLTLLADQFGLFYFIEWNPGPHFSCLMDACDVFAGSLVAFLSFKVVFHGHLLASFEVQG
jgi:hypothetical protein